MKAILRRGAFALFALASTQSFADEIVCPRPISEKICYVENDTSNECMKPPKWVRAFEFERQLQLTFEHSPTVMKQAMCDVENIYVAGEFEHGASAYVSGTSVWFSWDSLSRFSVSFRGLVEEDLMRYARGYARQLGVTGHVSSDHWRFTDGFELSYEVEHKQPKIEGLNYSMALLILHEFAHVMEHFPRYGNVHDGGYFYCNSKYQNDNQMALLVSPKKLRGYVYETGSKTLSGQSSDIVRELQSSNYATFYAMANAWEDFAEAFSQYVLLEYFALNYRVKKGDEVIFDREKQFENANMQAKLDIVKMVLDLPKFDRNQRIALRKDRKLCQGLFDPTLLTDVPG